MVSYLFLSFWHVYQKDYPKEKVVGADNTGQNLDTTVINIEENSEEKKWDEFP